MNPLYKKGEYMVNEIAQLISTVGFPIAASCGLFWFCNKLTDKMTDVISENTKIIAEVKTIIESSENGVDK